MDWLPASPNRPTRPYWVTNGSPGISIPDPAIPDAIMEGTTLSLGLQSAGYDASTKTCTSVACHLQQTSVQWGAVHGYGGPNWENCQLCHPL
jgi:hypothetical protein